MIQTIVLIQNGKYPFGEVVSLRRAIRVQQMRSYADLQQLRQQKSKMQRVFSSSDKSSQTTISSHENSHLIKLTKIYQQQLMLHYIYEYVPYSLTQYIEKQILPQIDLDKSHIVELNSKLFIKKISYELGIIINLLVKKRVKANLEFHLLGIDYQENLKLFVNSDCQILGPQSTKDIQSFSQIQQQQVDSQLKEFYQQKKQLILFRLDDLLNKYRKIEPNVPNFVIKGNQLHFQQPQPNYQSQPYSPCPSNFTESSFTDRCESIDNHFIKQSTPDENIRKTQGNLFNKLKKTQSYNYNTESNKKLHQNMLKLENLRKKSKKLNDQLKQNFLSSSQCFPPNSCLKESNQFQKRGSTQFQPIFAKKNYPQRQQTQWRNSQIPQKLRKTQFSKDQKQKQRNRFGSFNLDGQRSKSYRNHKSSFQFKPKKDRDYFNPNKSFDKGFQDDFQQNNYQQSRSVRIEVQQKLTGNKERKSSFKVKILTCQQMQMDGQNLQEFVLKTMNKNFSQGQQRTEQQNNKQQDLQDDGRKSNRSHSSKYSQRFKNIFTQKFKNQQKDDINTKFSQSPIKEHVRQRQRQRQREREKESSSQKNIFQKYNQHLGAEKQRVSKNPQLQQKIKMAKQKAEDVLNKYLKSKKYSMKNPKY